MNWYCWFLTSATITIPTQSFNSNVSLLQDTAADTKTGDTVAAAAEEDMVADTEEDTMTVVRRACTGTELI